MAAKIFVHPQGLCESANIGAGTRVWAFAHILPNAQIGSDCNICDHVFVENDVVVGNRVTVKSGVQLWDGVRLEDDVFVGPNATFTNDRFPHSRSYPAEVMLTIVRKGASIGANATILPGLEVGDGSMVGAGAVVTRNVQPYAIVAGNPGRIIGYVAGDKRPRPAAAIVAPVNAAAERTDLNVGNTSLYHMKRVGDLRGDLSVGEFEPELPFIPKRYFLVFNVPTREVRGEHAHRTCHQFLICVHGSCGILVDDGNNRHEMTLDRPELGVYLPPMVWATQFRYSADAVLLVFASHPYDSSDYIRTYDEFLREVSLRD